MRENKQVFTDLHNRLYERVFSFVRLRIRDHEEVKDIVQDVFLKAYNSWVSLPELPDENTARNYLFLIARQRMIDIWRSARHRLQTDLLNNKYDGDKEDDWSAGDFDLLPDLSPLPEDIFQDNENKKYAVELLNILNPLEREIMTLRYLQELEYKELSVIYKTSEDNIRQKVSRALQKLKKVAKEN